MDNFFPTNPIELYLIGIQKGEQRIDVKKMVESVAIYESVRSNSLSATITIRDGLDILSSMPIEGGESVFLEWKMSGKDVSNKNAIVTGKQIGRAHV